ncbi:TPA: SDR family oxidoreductase [Enterobacter hormaechei]|uniref:SDR family oxidoreductase n=1 Tax=Enterobacteriaceae TaxID=543 RepID=UPI0005EFA999|nr:MULTISPECIES: SDR family oxidoreductase [Enterobacteriaceae]HAS0757094.1 SDR family oxidoreductase [Enterobacter hormaechei subsp. xiangfangensis]EKS6332933.1 SDR family oxidoreductase [Enterobacter hormaechei]EKS6509313.1 SDR family oxidoreductase [Enterobacter hormaechei]EKT4031428.1 SDR family oxidoreductase [Enterobacter hormaechei]EKU4511914.1 SDR family oxidoreductase [Klebsiella aerogenes]
MAELQGKHLLIIGGSSGIGFEVAQRAGIEGATIMLMGRSQEKLDEARALLAAQGIKVSELIACDAHDHTALNRCFKSISSFDHLVSMVGDAMGGGFLAADMSTIEQVIHSKCLTNILIGKLASKKLHEGGSITFTSGTGGKAQHACASYIGNLAIQALAQGLAAEIAPKGRVNTVAPTWTATPFWRKVSPDEVEKTRQHFAKVIPLQRTANVEELASAYLFLMKNDFITGQQLAIDGGIMLG